jgi:uncharacterized low-complexity protein
MSKKTLIAAAAGSAFVAGLAAAPLASAADNPFALSGLASGYQIADSHMEKEKEKAKEGKCGAKDAKAKEGKCGASMSKGDEMKVDEGKTSDERMKAEPRK